MVHSIRFALCLALAGLLLTLSRAAPAYSGTQTFTGSESGTTVSLSFDLDADSSPPWANVNTVAGSLSSDEGDARSSRKGRARSSHKGEGGARLGAFTGQRIVELDATLGGTGCPFGGPTQMSCTLAGTASTGCLFHRVGSSGTSAIRFEDGSLLIFGSGTGDICLQISTSLPFNITGSYSSPIVGGTGRFAGATGSITTLTHDGQILAIDAAGHSFGWLESTLTGTLTLPDD